MNALLKLIPTRTIITWLVTKFFKSSPVLLEKARNLVASAEKSFPSVGSGADKAAWVKAELSSAFKYVKTHTLETVIGIAVQEVKTRT